MFVHSAALDTLGRSGGRAASPVARRPRGRAASPTRLARRPTMRVVVLTFGGLLVSLLAMLT